MVISLFLVAIIIGLFCPSILSAQLGKMDACDKVFILIKGVSKQITEEDEKQKIIEEIIRLFSQADDIYLKSFSKSEIDKFRKSICVEVLFARPKDIDILRIKQKKTIHKILIPLDRSMCVDKAHIFYGDPDYKPFNVILNSEGCEKLKEIINGKLGVAPIKTGTNGSST